MVERASWSTARALTLNTGHLVPSQWHSPEVVREWRVLRTPDGANRILGMYLAGYEIDAAGTVVLRERIIVYLLPSEECWLPIVLTHEYLHAIHTRLVTKYGTTFTSMDSESWVQATLGFHGELAPCITDGDDN
jgi:hypothetical protein